MWLKKAQEIYSNNDELGNVYIFGINKNPELTFLSKQDFYVSFITFWHFDLPMNELNYQFIFLTYLYKYSHFVQRLNSYFLLSLSYNLVLAQLNKNYYYIFCHQFS